LSTPILTQQHDRPDGTPYTPWLFFLAALLLALPLAYFADIPERDIALRYAPMAEAFAAGEWTYAFHPRVPILYPVLCGALVRAGGMTGFAAARLVSVVCFAAAVFPLFRIMKRLFGEQTATGVLLIYIVNPFILRLSGTGLRENLKCLLLILIVHAILMIREKPDSFARYLYLGLGAGITMITRSEMILFCGIVMFGVMFWEACWSLNEVRDGSVADPSKKSFVPVPYRSLAGTLLAAGLTFLPAVVNHSVFGLPTPEIRYLTLFEASFGRVPALSDAALIAGLTPFAMAAAAKILARFFSGKRLKPTLIVCACVFAAGFAVLFIRQLLQADLEVIQESFFSLGRSFDPLWTVPALVGLTVRLRNHTFSSDEKLLLSFIAVYTGVIAAQIFLSDKTLNFSSRYLLPVSPLGFGWTFFGLTVITGLAVRFFPRISMRSALTVLLCFYVAGSLLHCLGPILKDYFEPRHKITRNGTLRMAALFRANPPVRSHAAPPGFEKTEYEGCATPGIFFERDSKYIVSAYLAGGRLVHDPANADFYVASPETSAVPPDDDWIPMDEKILVKQEKTCTVFRRKEAVQ